MWFKRKKSPSLDFNVTPWIESLMKIKSSLEIKTNTLEIEAKDETEIGKIKKEAVSAARICTKLLEFCLISLSESLPPRDARRRKEYADKISIALMTAADTHAQLTTPYDYKTRLLPAIERLHTVIAECVTV